MTLPPDKLAYRPKEAAVVLGIGKTKLFELIGRGKIEAGWMDGIRVITRDALEAYFKATYKPGGVK